MDPRHAQRVRREIHRLSHLGLEPFAFRRQARGLVHEVVPFDASCWLTMDPASILMTGGLFDYPVEVAPALARNEFEEEDVNKMVVLARQPLPVGILSQATGGQPERSARYREILKPAGLEAELRGVYRSGGNVWGGGALYRERGSPGFDPEEAAFVGSISGLLGEGFRRSLVTATINGASQVRDGPGLLVLAPDFSIEAMTPEAERWIDELDEPVRLAGKGALHPVVLQVAGRARAIAAGVPAADTPPASGRILTRTGRWLLVHASLLDGQLSGRTAVILEPARPLEIAPLIVEAYRLTQREQQITALVLQGFPTSQIAIRLCLSPLTVQDYLKAIFDKMAVSSRREMAGRIFFDHHFPPTMSADLAGSTRFTTRLGFEP